jgi:hypothetical protein
MGSRRTATDSMATEDSRRYRLLYPVFCFVSGLMFEKVLGIIRAEISRMVSASTFLARNSVALRRLLFGNFSSIVDSTKSIHHHANLCSQGT